MKYSKLQYFFWLISGCEINVLKDCPTDYNRQAGIGLTIFMTTILAAASGSYAGWFFSKNIYGAIGFGLLWAALIFSIDRSMVITMKKDPTKTKQSLWIPFVARAVLAILIAFIISIPLELFIFHDNIDLHVDQFQLNKINHIQDLATRNEDVKGTTEDADKNAGEVKKVTSELKAGTPVGDLIYNGLRSDYEERNKQYVDLKNALNRAEGEASIAYRKIPTDPVTQDIEKSTFQYEAYLKKHNKEDATRKAYRAFNQNGLSEAKTKLDDYYLAWLKAKNERQKSLNKRADSLQHRIDAGKGIANQTGDILKKKLKDKNEGFVFRFMVLEDLATVSQPKENSEGKSILFLLWLIRILFFTVEILPTVAKIFTPVGAYDRAIYQKEIDFQSDLDQNTQDYLVHQKNVRDLQNLAELAQLKQQVNIEKKLHEKILNEVAQVQGEVAHHKIEEFRKLHVPNRPQPASTIVTTQASPPAKNSNPTYSVVNPGATIPQSIASTPDDSGNLKNGNTNDVPDPPKNGLSPELTI